MAEGASVAVGVLTRYRAGGTVLSTVCGES